jgi:spermidine/putrescine transport system ATP-binding protein
VNDAVRAGARSSTAAASCAIELRRARKVFGESVALDEVSLEIERGEFFSLLGPSGCGKSTTLNLIGGFEAPTSGDVLIEGRSMAQTPPFERPVNTVFQSYALFPHMTVAENVEFGLRMKGVSRAERRAAASEMFNMVSLSGYEARRPGQLSGGQRQRVALARALVNRPSVLLLDEPLGALDLKLRKQMQIELTRLQRQVGITFVYVTHDQEEAMAMSDRIGVMSGGRLLQVGAPSEIYDRPSHRFVMEFIGAANGFEGRLVGQANGIGAVDVDGVGRLRGRVTETAGAHARVALLVRPEKMRLSFEDRPTGDSECAGVLAHVSRLGFVTHYTVRLDSGKDVLCYRLADRDDADAVPLEEGRRVVLSWNEDDARIFLADQES